MSCAGILLEGHLRELDQRFTIANCYGPYADRHKFWSEMEDSGLLKDLLLILGGDLNLTLSDREVWGHHSWLDHLSDWFKHIFQEANLINVLPYSIKFLFSFWWNAFWMAYY